MSAYIDIINRIKAEYTCEWLTPSQRRVYREVAPFLGPPHRVLNIYGQEGVGKTFLGWVFDKQGLAFYFPSVLEVTGNRGTVVIDNADSARDFVRGLRNVLQSKQIGQAIILTRYQADDSIPSFRLDLTNDDMQVFKSNLFRHLDLRVADGDFANLWRCLLQAATV